MFTEDQTYGMVSYYLWLSCLQANQSYTTWCQRIRTLLTIPIPYILAPSNLTVGSKGDSMKSYFPVSFILSWLIIHSYHKSKHITLTALASKLPKNYLIHPLFPHRIFSPTIYSMIKGLSDKIFHQRFCHVSHQRIQNMSKLGI